MCILREQEIMEILKAEIVAQEEIVSVKQERAENFDNDIAIVNECTIERARLNGMLHLYIAFLSEIAK